MQLTGEDRIISERKFLGGLFDEKIEGVDHRHLGHEVDFDPQLAHRLGKDQPGQMIAVRVLLPVEVVGVGLDCAASS